MRASECPGRMSAVQGEALGRLAAQVPREQCIIEIGVYLGRSGLYLAEGSSSGNNASVFLVDPWDLPRPSKERYSSRATFEAAMQNIEAASAVTCNLTAFKEFSRTVARGWAGSAVGLLHIDADHRYGPVLQDVADWAPHLAPGAAIAFDDYAPEFPGVIRAVDELFARGKLDAPGMVDRMVWGTWRG